MRTLVIYLLLLSLLAACADGSTTPAPPPQPTATETAVPTATPLPAATPVSGPPTVFVHLFGWRWTDVARECENFLGPMGFAAVQISPPQEHIVVDGFPWWQRYQPVSYRLESRSGSRAELADMIARCQAVGVDVYADAVINHMAGIAGGVGYAGTPFQHYDYPGLYDFDDFHHCGRHGDDDIRNYGDRTEVQTCELLNLADLDTGSPAVQDQIAAYLNDLIGLGVTGFRIDGSKHIAAADLAAILSRLDDDPYIYQEVIDQGGEPITAGEYFATGDVTEFNYGANLSRIFRQENLADLEQFGAAWGFMPSDIAIVFVDNHDNQRGHGGGGGVLTHKDGDLYRLANVFMLAWPYGYPRIMSSFHFENSDQGPPADADGRTLPVYQNGAPTCRDGWVCEHRWPEMANMIAFHNRTAVNFFVTDWWSNGRNQIAFGRGDAGFVVINREETELGRTFATSLPPGDYCDVISGSRAPTGDSCTGVTITVAADGSAAITVPAMRAAAIHTGSKLMP